MLHDIWSEIGICLPQLRLTISTVGAESAPDPLHGYASDDFVEELKIDYISVACVDIQDVGVEVNFVRKFVTFFIDVVALNVGHL